MRFSFYKGAQGGIRNAINALASPGGDAYGGQMKDLAYVDSAQAGARRDDSETALNQQTYDAGQRMLSPEMAAALGQLVPQGMDPNVYTSGWMASSDRKFDDFTKGFQNLNAGSATMQALNAALAGDVDGMNRLNTVAKPGETYEPFKLNETGMANAATGEYAFTPGHQALARQRDASAAESMAGARAADALARQRQFTELSPGASLYDLGGGASPVLGALDAAVGPSQSPAAPATAGAMPDGRPIIRNPDGSVSTHEMATVTDPRLNSGQATLLPTIVNGQRMSVQDALAAAVGAGGMDPTTGQPLQAFASPEEAETDYLLRQHPQIDREASWRSQQPGSASLNALPGAEPIGNATPGTQPAPIGNAAPLSPDGFQLAGGPRLVATAPGKPDGVKLQEIYDPSSPTGTRLVAQADAIGQPGKPGSKGVSITYDEQGRPIIEMGGRNDMTTAGRNRVDTELLDSGQTLSQLTAIRSRFKPEYQQIGTRWEAMKTAIKSKAGLDVGKDQRQMLQDFSAYRAEAGQMFSNILKSLSGAAVTPAEMKRAEGWLPNPGTGLWDGDDPITLASKIDRMEDFTRRAMAKYAYLRRNGLDVSAVDVDQMPQLMRQRGDAIAAELQAQGVPADAVGQAVKQRLADEFGMGAY